MISYFSDHFIGDSYHSRGDITDRAFTLTWPEYIDVTQRMTKGNTIIYMDILNSMVMLQKKDIKNFKRNESHAYKL